jgi:hypothetical protein
MDPIIPRIGCGSARDFEIGRGANVEVTSYRLRVAGCALFELYPATCNLVISGPAHYRSFEEAVKFAGTGGRPAKEPGSSFLDWPTL